MEQMVEEKTCYAPDVVVKATQVVTRHSTDIFASKDQYLVSALKYIHGNLDKKSQRRTGIERSATFTEVS